MIPARSPIFYLSLGVGSLVHVWSLKRRIIFLVTSENRTTLPSQQKLISGMFLIFFSPSVYERPLLLQSDNFVIKIHPGRVRCRNCVNNLAFSSPPPPLMVTTKWPPVLWCTKRKLVCFCLFVWLLASCHSPTTVVRVCVIWSWVSAQKFLIIRWFILPNNAKGKCEHQWFGTFSFYRYVTN